VVCCHGKLYSLLRFLSRFFFMFSPFGGHCITLAVGVCRGVLSHHRSVCSGLPFPCRMSEGGFRNSSSSVFCSEFGSAFPLPPIDHVPLCDVTFATRSLHLHVLYPPQRTGPIERSAFDRYPPRADPFLPLRNIPEPQTSILDCACFFPCWHSHPRFPGTGFRSHPSCPPLRVAAGFAFQAGP